MTKENVVKIGDLGIATIVENSGSAHTFAGTRPYMSPELYKSFMSRPFYNNKTDVWLVFFIDLFCIEVILNNYRELAGLWDVYSMK